MKGTEENETHKLRLVYELPGIPTKLKRMLE